MAQLDTESDDRLKKLAGYLYNAAKEAEADLGERCACPDSRDCPDWQPCSDRGWFVMPIRDELLKLGVDL